MRTRWKRKSFALVLAAAAGPFRAYGGPANSGQKKRGVAVADTHTGTCFCGAVAIDVTGVPEEIGYCHCNSCRSYSGGPVNAFTLWKAENLKVTRRAVPRPLQKDRV